MLREQDRERQKELELIKQQYLGGEKVKKKILKPSEKFRFNFDWEVTDDTSRDLNPLYNNTHEAALLFGRGLRAGIDRREQKKQAAEFEKEVLRKMRESQVRAQHSPLRTRVQRSFLPEGRPREGPWEWVRGHPGDLVAGFCLRLLQCRTTTNFVQESCTSHCTEEDTASM